MGELVSIVYKPKQAADTADATLKQLMGSACSLARGNKTKGIADLTD